MGLISTSKSCRKRYVRLGMGGLGEVKEEAGGGGGGIGIVHQQDGDELRFCL